MTPHFPTGLSHPSGFFGRRGGVSKGVYECLNCGFGSDDDPEHVAENLARVRGTLGANALLTNRQVHSATALFVEDASQRHAADGLVTTTPGLAIGALSADCAPVLLEADGIVGACHAGWRGAVSGITDSTVALMRDKGATNIRAVVGPCISLQSYEVGDAFRDTATAIDPKASQFFTDKPMGTLPWIGDKLHFDLPSYVMDRLQRAGVEAQSVDICTYALPDQYFSYRYNTHQGVADYGRNISAIVIR